MASGQVRLPSQGRGINLEVRDYVAVPRVSCPTTEPFAHPQVRASLPWELVMRKDSPSAFWGTPLMGHLNYHNVDTIIACGETTSGCVRASVLDGCTNRYRMIVVEECVFDRHEAAHAINLFDMHQKYADVLPLAEVLEYLGEVGAKRGAAS